MPNILRRNLDTTSRAGERINAAVIMGHTRLNQFRGPEAIRCADSVEAGSMGISETTRCFGR